jgi:hypothetical protein
MHQTQSYTAFITKHGAETYTSFHTYMLCGRNMER